MAERIRRKRVTDGMSAAAQPEVPPRGMEIAPTVAALCARYQYDPLEALIVIALDRQVPVGLRVQCHQTIAKYRYHQLKSIEHTMDDETRKVIIHRYGMADANGNHH